MLRAGQLIERYVVEDYLGHGGMAVVYRVRHARLGSLHALKVLTVPRPSVRERLLQEGQAQASLRHPNIVGVTDVLQVEGSPALLMEYVDGPTLERWLQQYRAEVGEMYALARAIVAGVGEAHARGFVHRDLKPANVLLARTSTGFVPKVADFGISKLLEEGAKPSTTASNIAMGTPHYMAPEQIRDAQGADARADIFSIGALLYEVATGKRAFPGDDVLTVLNAVAEVDVVPPYAVVSDLPEGLVRAIEGCLVQDPDARFQSCNDVIAQLADGPGDAAVLRGLEMEPSEWEDTQVRRSRADWLGTAPPAHDRAAAPEVTGVDTADPPERREARDSDAPTLPIPAGAETVPSPSPRVSRPDEEQTLITHGPQRPFALVLLRRVAVSAVFGTVIGLIAFLAWVTLTGWPRQQVQPVPAAPEAGLDEVLREPGAP